MRKNWKEIVQIVTCILLVVCVIQNMILRMELNNFRTNTNSKISDVYYEINNITSEVSRVLEEEASILSHVDFVMKEADMDAGTVKVNCEILPKEYSPSTEAAVIIDNQEYPLELTGEQYEGELEVSLFEDTIISSAVLKDGDVRRTENLDWYISPRYDYLPVVYAYFGGSASLGSQKDGKCSWELAGNIDISMYVKGESVLPELAYFYVTIDGEEIERRELELPQDSHNMSYELNKRYEVPTGSTMTLYVEVVDEHGLHHKAVVEKLTLNEDGERTDDMHWGGSAASIYDADGKLLFSEL